MENYSSCASAQRYGVHAPSFFKHWAEPFCRSGSAIPEVFLPFDAICIGSAENNYLGKPHPSAFHHYIVTHPSHGKQRLLIDNRARNIAFARAFHIAGIRYRSAASLQRWFKADGIL